ncbi:hypothetical protein HTY54_18025 [Escherichia coli]|nr:hypothetical protein [Escherichia coli]
MAELTALHTLTAQMKREGIRRLLVLSGEEGWCFDHALKLRDALPGDWLWISPQPDAEKPLFSLGATNFTWARVPACGIRRPSRL